MLACIFNSFLASDDFCCPLIIFANRLNPDQDRQNVSPGPEVIKLEFILKLKIKRKHVRKQPIIVLYFEFETVLKFYNLGPGLDPNHLTL